MVDSGPRRASCCDAAPAKVFRPRSSAPYHRAWQQQRVDLQSAAGTYRKYLGEAARAHALAIHAYVVMSNHVHLLVTPSAATSAPRTMQSIGDRYAKYFNFIHSRTGTVWEGRYKATAV